MGPLLTDVRVYVYVCVGERESVLPLLRSLPQLEFCSAFSLLLSLILSLLFSPHTHKKKELYNLITSVFEKKGYEFVKETPRIFKQILDPSLIFLKKRICSDMKVLLRLNFWNFTMNFWKFNAETSHHSHQRPCNSF